MKDGYGRKIENLRVSITNRCNLRCVHCTHSDIDRDMDAELLTADQIIEICRAAVEAGIYKFRITGGEPLLREDCAEIIAGIKAIRGVQSVSMTTNGTLLRDQLPRLMAAGLDSVNISLDTMNRERYQQLTGFDLLPAVADGVKAAVKAGLPVKLNVIIQRSFNMDEWHDMVRITQKAPIDVRFIETIPVGKGSSVKLVANTEIYKMIMEKYPDAEPDDTRHGDGPARYIRIPGFPGSIGFISTIHDEHFCSNCNRIRLNCTGELVPCVSIPETEDLKAILNMPEGNFRIHMLNEAMKYASAMKPARHGYTISDYHD